jgi:dienelactone hydrolase
MARRAGVLAVVLAGIAAGAVPAVADYTPAGEARNYSKIDERFRYESGTPAYQAMLRERGAAEEAELMRRRTTDPERDSTGNLCASHMDGCAGDVRFFSWQTDGFGVRRALTFVARNGGVISAHLWYTAYGPAVRPAIVITTGSVQAPEELYAYAATTLAKRGYVVLTYDVITQGSSDNRGEGPDSGYYQAQSPDAFVDGTVDALDFLLSSPAHPYRPRFPSTKLDRSASLQADHNPKQLRRVAARLSAPYNPVSPMVDPTRIGIAGHSLGAFGVSRVAADDPRVKAVVAWDNLSVGGASAFGPTAPIPPRVPALGMSNDYGLTPTPYQSAPDPQGKNIASRQFSAKGVDSMQVNLRGGTHYEYSYIPNPGFGATLRGMDMAAWYTAAWFDRYVKGDPSAESRLLTTRWLADARTKEIDPGADGNMFSDYFASRVDLRRAGGQRVTCESLRAGKAGCPALAPDVCTMPSYSYLAEAQTKDGAPPPPTVSCPAGRSLAIGEPPGFDPRLVLRAPRLASDSGRASTFEVAVRPRSAAAAATVERYELQVLRGGRWRALGPATGIPRVRFRGVDGAQYDFRARARGRGTAAGPWLRARTIVPRDDRLRRTRGTLRLAPNPLFAGGWARRWAPGAYRGSLTVAGRRGATMTYRFRGRHVYVVGRRGPLGGLALAVLDGRPRLVSFGAARTADRRVVASLAARGRGVHTLRLLSLSRRAPGSRGTQVAIDALAVAR